MPETKADLEQQIAELQAQLAEAQASAQAATAQRMTMEAEREGWLITTPNPAYDGRMHGIEFVNGQAFIAKGARVEAFETQPMKPDDLAKFLAAQYPAPGYTDADRAREAAAIREREKMTSAERAARTIAADFGYRVEFFGAERLAELRPLLSTRQQQRMEVEAMQRAQTQADMIMRPGYMGG